MKPNPIRYYLLMFLAMVVSTFSAHAATVTFSFSNTTQTYDGTPKAVTVTTNPANRPHSVTYNGSTTVPTNAGSYNVVATATGAGDTGSGNTTLTINKASQSINFPQPADQSFANGSVALSASATSGLTVSFAIISGPATVSGNVVSFTGTGAVTVRTTQAGNGNYNAAAAVDRTFNINATAATVTFSNLSQVYNGTPRSVTVSTVPPGLAVSVTYSGSATPPTNVGLYAVVANVTQPGYSGSASDVLQVTKATQTITFPAVPNAIHPNNSIALGASASSGLPITYTVLSGPATVNGNGISLSSTGVGTVTVRASQAGNTNYEAATSVEQTFNITTSGSVILSNLSRTYDGTPKAVTATTTPAGLAVTITYDGSAIVPTNVGSYAVVATINDPNYAGTANGTLVIAKASQTITFPAISNYEQDIKAVPLAATASSGLAVTYTVVSGPAEFVDGKLTLTGEGEVTVRAAQAGNANYNAAANVDRTFTALPGKGRLLLVGDSFTQGGLSGGGDPLPGYRDPFIRMLRGDPTIDADNPNPFPFDYTSFIDLIGTQTTTFNANPLNSDYPNSLAYDPQHEGHYGWAADDILNGNPNEPGAGKLSTWIESYDYLPSRVMIHIGTVDALHQRDDFNFTQNARAELSGIIDTLRASSPLAQIWVAKLPPGAFWPGGDGNKWRAALNSFNAMLDGLAAEKNAAANAAGKLDYLFVVDNNAEFDADTMLDPDGLHPNSAGQTFIAANFMRSILWSLNGQSGPGSNNEVYAGPPRILCLGDDITQGGNGQHSYREPLSRLFAGENLGGANPSAKVFNVDFLGTMTTSDDLNPGVETFPVQLQADPQHEGHLTYTAGDILNGRADSQVEGGFGKLSDWLRGYTPDIVLLHIGSRDAWNNFDLSDPNFAITAKNNIGGICNTIKADNPEAAIFLAKLIPGKGWYNDAVNAINNTLAAMAADLNATNGTPFVFLVDMNTGFDAGTMYADDIHPNATGAEFMAVRWYNAISSYLSGAGLFPEINSSLTATGTINAAFTYSITATGAPTSFAATGLPAGFSINTATGVISGTPAATGTHNITISASNAAGTDTETLVLTVGKAVATVTLSNLSQAYTGTGKSATITTTPAGLTTAVTYDGSATLPINAGSYAVVATVNDTLYQGTANGTLVITKAAQTIDFPALSSVSFAVGTVPVSATASSTLPVSFSVVSGPATVSGSTLTLTGAGDVVVRASQAGNSNFAAAADVDQTLTVTKAPAVASLSNLNHVYDGSAKVAAATTTPAGLATTLTYEGSATPPTAAGSYAVVATIVDANYAGSIGGTLAISKAAQTITFPAPADTSFGGATVSLAATSSAGLPVTYSIVSGSATISGNIVTPTGAGVVTVRAEQAGNANFLAASPVEQTLNVSKAAAAVTLSGLSYTYDGTLKSASASTSPASLGVSITYDGSVTPPTNAGSYAVVATITDANYSGTTTQTLVINKASQTLDFPVLSDVSLDAGTLSLSATTSSGLPVTYTVLSGSATVSGNLLTLTGAGPINIRASQDGNVNYSAATPITRIFSVGKGSQTITFAALPNVTFDIGTVPLSATSSVGLPVSFSILSGPATVSGSVITLTGTGTVTVRASQSGDNNYAAAANVDRSFSVTQANATVTLANLSQTYDGSAKTVSASTQPGNLAVNVTYNGSSTAPTNAGTYAVVATINDASFSGSVSGTLVINKATATITLGNLNHAFDGAQKSATATTDPAGRTVNITYDGSPTPPSQTGGYTVVATIDDPNYAGTATATMVIGSDSHLVNLASRSLVGAGSDIMIPGFVISGTGTKKLLIRGVGPELQTYGVSGVLMKPTLKLFRGSELLATNTGWSTAANAIEIALAADAVGAFQLPVGSDDCAMLVDLAAGDYTVHLAGINGETGVGLVEIYDVDENNPTARLVNIATRAQVGTGGNILIPGYVIDGEVPRKVLVRAVGPTLGSTFGVGGVLENPTLTIFKGSDQVATNDDWGTNANLSELITTTTNIGAFDLVSGSKDAAILITLPPGGYTVQVSGVGGTTGVALVEIYEIQE